MNWDHVQGKRKQMKGEVKEKWGKITDHDLDVIDGKRQQLVGKIQEYYGAMREEVEHQADEFAESLNTEDRREIREEARQGDRARHTGR